MIGCEDECPVRNLIVIDMISDRMIVNIKLAISKPGTPKTYRKYHAINIKQPLADMRKCDFFASPYSILVNLIEHHNIRITNLINRDASMGSKVVT